MLFDIHPYEVIYSLVYRRFGQKRWAWYRRMYFANKELEKVM